MQDYDEFVDKFKHKKTTDDCYTPPAIYEAVLTWCEKEYGIDRASVIRPFKPGGGVISEKITQGELLLTTRLFQSLRKLSIGTTSAALSTFCLHRA